MSALSILIKLLFVKASKFDRKTLDPLKVQKDLLFNILKENAGTVFGKEHAFSSIKTVEDYQKNVPVNNYETLRPYIKRMLKGEDGILTKEKPIFFGITSGTTNKPKLIPVTKSSRKAKSEVMGLWLYYILSAHPGTLNGKSLVIMSPAIEGYAPSGVPYGSESGDAYQHMPPFIRKSYAIPYETFCIKDYEARYYAILRIAMGQNVSNFATLNPLTILVICQKIDKYSRHIIDDIRKGTLSGSFRIGYGIRKAIEKGLKPDPRRASFLEKLLIEKGTLLPKDFWPNMETIECWTGGTVGMYIKEIVKFFPDGIRIRDFGYVSSEARCSIPVSDNGPSGILTIDNNFYEFMPEEDLEKENPRYLTVERLKKDKRYYIFFTTLGGLYRYNIDDIIKVVGFYNKTPVIEFIQKGKNVSSATGEKLYESQVISAINKAKELAGVGVEFFCACLEWQIPPSYSFLVEFSSDHDVRQKKNFLNNIENSLGEINIEYKAKRASQRLGDPKLKVLEKGSFEKFRMAKLATLQHDSQFKASHLRSDFKIPSEFKIIEEISLI